MIAKVIVDVPSSQTDRSFDYAIPEQWVDIIQEGTRVIVPFGPRKIQGFIVEITEESEFKQVKPILEVLDVIPVLTAELIRLGDWLSKQTLSFKLSAYQLMIPAALRAKVTKEIHLLTDSVHLPKIIQPLFKMENRITWGALNENKLVLKAIQEAAREGFLEIAYLVEEKGKKKTERFVRVSGNRHQLDDIPARAGKQKELLTYIEETKQPLKVTSLLEETQMTRATLTTLIKKGYVEEFEKEVYRDPLGGVEYEKTEPLQLTEKQSEAIAPILDSLNQNMHDTFLLHGVTGSGKTEVYLQAIAKALSQGREAIVLVPEISLTPQMVQRFKGRFGSQVAVFHSGLSMGEKYDEWRKIRRNEVRVVVGARSAIFAPFTNVGIIIIDEEHETSYKQEENPRYHARDVAIWRGKEHQCPVILGSATPSLESYARAIKGVYHLLPLTERVNNRAMPTVNVVDMREELRQGNRSMFSNVLLEQLKDRLTKGEQAVLFLNRRGYSTFVMCRDCGYVATCDHCDISLTYHRTQHALKCHYCGHEEKMPETCSSCGSDHIRFFGSGTQKVEEELTKVLPEARVIRMDIDTTRRKGSHEKLLSAFGRGEADILLGTQMIAKGLDFPKITLVGVLAADSMLHIPDFRSAERTFQLMEQVSGRAGRHDLAGEVIIQSYTPDHYSIELVKAHDYERFFQMEMSQRKVGVYPPYVYMVLLNISHPELTQVIHVSEKIVTFLKRELSEQTVVLGPVASPLARIKDRYRYQCMIKYRNESGLRKTLLEIQQHYIREINQGQLQISIDMQPYMFT
ncbi:primosomal protein N' [Halalkalibacter akibai]|uniref:Replication restart protein PriA n=1 Tax=Halalkalibacter akibai (strain ATCC 43226 / DSM 21942 / CIP 109018 / JCM 9157 / 1139) TaxID=1236973 RepID=W4QQH3_HALA3|nr:primosomal protein N' [Halalkalibacter akibai]GAE33898.1 helicase PriA essential for oriC/DnaA-independent DNA replication [Halalkalibacter akibai JCM 9157]